MPSTVRNEDGYPTWIGMIFIFNLIVGTGALTLPSVFAKTGWLLGLGLIVLLAFTSYITCTFVIEAMACSNAILYFRRLQYLKRDRRGITANANANSSHSSVTDTDNISDNEIYVERHCVNVNSSDSLEQTPLFSNSSRNYYILDNKIELGEMAGLFFNNFGIILFYLCIAIYLYGDLSIYSAAVAKSLRDVMCQKNATGNDTTNGNNTGIDENEICWNGHTLTRLDCYRLNLIGFIMLLGPFVFFNIQKTKYIQMLTVIFRWFAFSVMIIIASIRLVTKGAEGHPPLADATGIPGLFGACVYSFMCHHSLPSIIAPISHKNRLKSLLSFDYSLICSFYIFLAVTGAFAFQNLDDLYTLNFIPDSDKSASIILKIIEYFLALFPVLTLSTSFPIIAITLRNNLQTLFLDMSRFESYHFMIRRLVFPLLAIVPPIVVTFYTDSVHSLVSFTGSYAGTGIQYLIPIALVYYGRRTCTDLLGHGIINDYRSPFGHTKWLICTLIWSITCVIFVTVNFFINSP